MMDKLIKRIDWKRLVQRGFVVIDDALPEHFAKRLVDESRHLHKSGEMFPNATRWIDGKDVVSMEKPRIYEQELSNPLISTKLVHFSQLNESISAPETLSLLSSQINASLASLSHPQRINLIRQASKVQVNTGGCFPMHTDSDGKVDDRKLSAILYLNPDWKEEHAGQLRLYPFPYTDEDIAPIFNRLVVFPSVSLLHRVLPSNSRERLCCTFWFSGTVESECFHVPEGHEHVSDSTIRNAAARLLYAQHWDESLRQSHAGSDTLNTALEKHWKDISVVFNAIGKYSHRFVSSPLKSDTDESLVIKWF